MSVLYNFFFSIRPPSELPCFVQLLLLLLCVLPYPLVHARAIQVCPSCFVPFEVFHVLLEGCGHVYDLLQVLLLYEDVFLGGIGGSGFVFGEGDGGLESWQASQ